MHSPKTGMTQKILLFIIIIITPTKSALKQSLKGKQLNTNIANCVSEIGCF
jgi:hypothetical protein